MNIHHINKLQLLLSIILLLGIVSLVYLSQRQQIIKSKATVNPYDAFEVTDTDGNTLDYTPGSIRVYNTDSLDIKIKIKDINGLIQ